MTLLLLLLLLLLPPPPLLASRSWPVLPAFSSPFLCRPPVLPSKARIRPAITWRAPRFATTNMLARLSLLSRRGMSSSSHAVAAATKEAPVPPSLWKIFHGISPISVPMDEPFPGVPALVGVPSTPIATQITKLPNGVSVVTDNRPGLLASVGVFSRSGSAAETDATAGSAFLQQRAALKDTTSRSHFSILRSPNHRHHLNLKPLPFLTFSSEISSVSAPPQQLTPAVTLSISSATSTLIQLSSCWPSSATPCSTPKPPPSTIVPLSKLLLRTRNSSNRTRDPSL